MKMFLIVIAMIASPGSKDTDLYIIQEPNFKQPQHCLQFVQINNPMADIQKAQAAVKALEPLPTKWSTN